VVAKSDYTNEKLEVFASYKRLDGIGGTVRGFKHAAKLGQPVRMPIGNFNLDQIESAQVYQLRYEHPKHELLSAKLLDGLTMPEREIDDFEIYHVDRRFFMGEAAVKMLERILGIDTSISAIYKSYGNSAYQNNHATYSGVPKGFTQGRTVEGYVKNN
jgi:hypothetical protein